MQSLFVEAVQIAHDLFQTTRGPSLGHPCSSTVLGRPTHGGAIWTIRVFPDYRMARLRDHRREGLAALPARIT
eukprot:1576508-Pyramimonas_sp.AAC.1